MYQNRVEGEEKAVVAQMLRQWGPSVENGPFRLNPKSGFRHSRNSFFDSTFADSRFRLAAPVEKKLAFSPGSASLDTVSR